ncbi:hypothetical protein CJF42_07655 [Pseudoalteromonas sp. NBT06-2]|uniref:STAS domain-containing protein n=1 Tax=Pseudoalteromonas sp. NBT06-2 TaxID=2025950 RepID=UPI000BA7C4B3|nr:STAS domain-containing protein [Pseudoalteromonas sp. NBT06-2]PAJ74943.1 hypothetical protein CJF42_07655 [Pseudoalteromonas sp. NBT06-2]
MNFSNKKINQSILLISIDHPRLDASSTPDFKEYFSNVVKSQFSKVVLDLSSVKFMDSSGLGALIFCLKNMVVNGEIVIVGAQANVLGLFTLTRMDRLFTHYGELSDVLAEIA